MPATKDAMTRYRILDELLSDRYHNYSLDDLTEEVCLRLCELNPDSNGVTRRCIEKDLHYLELESPFMVDIERYSVAGYNQKTGKDYSKRCLRYADRSYSIFKKELNHDEEHLLHEVLSLLGKFDGLPNLDGLERLRLVTGVRRSERQIISFTKNPLENSGLFGELFTAISNRQVVELHYHRFAEPEKDLTCVLHPYLLKEYNRRWYVFGAHNTGHKLLHFALDRIDCARPLPSYKYVECSDDLSERFDDIIGVTLNEGESLSQIIFWVSNTSKDYVCTKPIHDSQICYKGERDKQLREEHPYLQGGAFFRIDCIKNYELIRELTSFGKHLIVLSPEKIKQDVRKYVEEMRDAYESLK